jgi:D-alanyl-D-alanine carboxypeptidase/D-alanyl-D-alanine-endopeptidase (penicillin-binding protein 4)
VSQSDSKTPSRRASNPLRAVFIVGIVGAIALSALTIFLGNVASRSEALSTKEPVPPLSVSVMSVRRHPDVLSRTTRLNAVRAGLPAFVSDLPTGSCTSMTWLGESLTSVNTTTTMVPGSVVKILTAIVAREVLGPDYRFTTEVRGAVVDGVVGDLFIVGGGDPVLVRNNYPATEKYPTLYGTSLDALADLVVGAGLKSILGAVVGVENRYDTQRFISVWPDSFNAVEAGPLGALISSDAIAGATGTRVAEPANGAALDFSSLLAARGISVTGSTRVGVAPEDLPLVASIQSAPLSDIAIELLVNSDNNTGELLLKELGFTQKGDGSTAAGLTVIQEFLQAKYPNETALLFDGSGLSAQNGFSCDLVITLLADNEEWLLESLPIAGETGTLRDMFKGSPAAGVMRAKTGTLTNVKALAGFVPVEDSEALRFVLILNSRSADQPSIFMPHWNDLAEVTALASASPTAAELAP